MTKPFHFVPDHYLPMLSPVPAMMAAATVDFLSGGRLEPGDDR